MTSKDKGDRPRLPGEHRTTPEERAAYKASGKPGYCSPPAHGQIRPGERRSPGRPKAEKNFDTFLKRELASKVVLNREGRPAKVSKREALAIQLVNKGLTGDARDRRLLLDHTRALESSSNDAPLMELSREEEEHLVLLGKHRKAKAKQVAATEGNDDAPGVLSGDKEGNP